MALPGFCGPTYQSRSLNADAQLCVNFLLEQIESGMGKGAFALYETPGLELFVQLQLGMPLGGVRGLYQINGRVFSVCGTVLWEVTYVAGVAATINRGTVLNDGKRAYLAADPLQLIIASGGQLYFYDLVANTLAVVAIFPSNGITISQVGFSDGFFMALRANSQQIYVSNPEDGSTWNLGQVAAVSVFSDNILRIKMDHREPWILGVTKIQPYFDSGATFPFDVVPGGFIETGIAAPEAVGQLDNSLFWIGSDERGHGIAWRANGYTPTRVSNHAVENAWDSYSTISDAISYEYQDGGHQFWVIYFPTANVTWVYDVATGQWHNRSYRDPKTGAMLAHRSQNHVFIESWNVHLVGDWMSGNLYQMALPRRNASGGGWRFCDDAGDPIERTRIAPPVSKEMEWAFHNSIQIDLEPGLGPEPPLTQAAPFPNVAAVLQDSGGGFWNLQVSDAGDVQTVGGQAGPAQGLILNDQASSTSWQFGITPQGMITLTAITFSSAYPSSLSMASAGAALFTVLTVSNGNIQAIQPTGYPRDPQVMISWSDDSGKSWSNERIVNCGQAGEFKRVITRRLGRSRNRLYKIRVTDPVPWRIINAYLKAEPDMEVPTKRLPKELGERA